MSSLTPNNLSDFDAQNVDNEPELVAVCDSLADLIVEAVEVWLGRSGGQDTHGPMPTHDELLASLYRDTKKE